jgi:hypothetical protein
MPDTPRRGASRGNRRGSAMTAAATMPGEPGVELGQPAGVHESLDLLARHPAAQQVHPPQRHGVARVLVQRLEPELERRFGLRLLEVHSRHPQERGDRPGFELPGTAEVGGGAAEVTGLKAGGAEHQEIVGVLAEAEHLRLQEAYHLGEPSRPEQPSGVAEVPRSHPALPRYRPGP